MLPEPLALSSRFLVSTLRLSAFIFLIAALATCAEAQTTPKNVLVLSGGRGRVSINQMQASLRSRFPGPVNFSIVDLDNPRFGLEAYQNHLAEALRSGYAGEKLDLVVAVMTPSLEFAVKYRDKVFPGVPVVFMSINPPLPETMGPGFTGVESPLGVREVIELALRLHPDTQTVAVVTNDTDVDKEWLAAEQVELRRYQHKVKEIDLVGPPSPELLRRIAALPTHTVVLFQLFPRDADQLAFGAFDVLSAVVQRFPTYSILPLLDRGAIGNATYDATNDAVLAGQLAARVLSGERAEDIPIVNNSNVLVSVNWRQLRRWNIPESALPSGAKVLYRDPTTWQRYWRYIVGVIAVMAVQSLLIVGLLWQRARKLKAEAGIRESEQRFRLVTDTAPVMIWMAEPDRSFTFFNKPWLEFTGHRLERGGDDAWTGAVHPDDVEACVDRFGRSFDGREPFQRQYRLRRHDGEYRWVFETGVPRFHADGAFAGYICSALDITERKLAEEALAGVGGRLIAAQELERRRIARELHDDINQQLSLLAISLAEIRRHPTDSAAAMRGSLDDVEAQARTVATSVQALSHRLHSSKLEYLGLASALRGFCREFSEQHHVTVEFRDESVPDDVPEEIALCLFRVTQAAVVNALKHSGATVFRVRLSSSPQAIHLCVDDDGVGFDVEKVLLGDGIGLISMRERVRFINGDIAIQSAPGGGTTIEVEAPLPEADGMQRA